MFTKSLSLIVATAVDNVVVIPAAGDRDNCSLLLSRACTASVGWVGFGVPSRPVVHFVISAGARARVASVCVCVCAVLSKSGKAVMLKIAGFFHNSD